MASPNIDRARRVAGAIQRELSDLIVNELNDPRVEGVTITDVRVVRGLRDAVIYVSRLDEAQYSPGGIVTPGQDDTAPKKSGKRRKVVPDENSPHAYVEVLNKASGLLRKHLGRRLSMKITPQLTFEYDETLASSYRISRLIEDDVATDPSGDGDQAADTSSTSESG